MMKRNLRSSLAQKKNTLITTKYALMFAPLVALIIYNRETYFTMKNGVSVGFGMALVLIVLVVMTKTETNLLKGVGGYIVILLISYLLKTILDEFWLIMLFATAGKLLSMTCDAPIRRYKRAVEKAEDVEVEETAKKEFMEIKNRSSDKYGNGRV